MPIPPEFEKQKYISLATFRKNGTAVYTPVWFAELSGKLYVKTRNDSGKYKRIRNNPRVQIAPSDMRGKITGPEFEATAHILPRDQSKQANDAIKRKYLLARLPFWSSKNEFLEIDVSA